MNNMRLILGILSWSTCYAKYGVQKFDILKNIGPYAKTYIVNNSHKTADNQNERFFFQICY